MIQITKAKILKESIAVEFTRKPKEGKPSKVTEEHKDPAHEDLKKSFETLAVHAALIAEFIGLDDIKDIDGPEHPLLKNINVTGFSLSGEDECQVILTGLKTLKSGKVMMFNTPLLRFEDASENAYPFAEILRDKIEEACQEMTAYLHGKHAADAQLSLDLDEKVTKLHVGKATMADKLNEAMNEIDIKAETKSGKAKKRVAQSAAHPNGEA